MARIRLETPDDVTARERLLDAAFGDDRFAKTCERLREGRLPALALVAEDARGRLIGTVRLWPVEAGPGRPALMLGPLAVDAASRGDGLGGRLMRAALNRAALAGHEAVLLVGDAPYYARFGFAAELAQALEMPGPVERRRFLGLELRDGALAGARGLVIPTGEPAAPSLPAQLAPADAVESLRQAA
ncbi:N-acetyltransferase [Alsobacter sp. SYSU M60028]|uniref:N-acetyltransferase n=1 Tax=Alsobacter ponti TaxID=2962936 RepID=A0ABT1LEZ9_9HYPH|nr:N-acetyltransferase [Alsobacter ponti]MCP8939703.1 N-acetyltransferase [Alsobacter ponti]